LTDIATRASCLAGVEAMDDQHEILVDSLNAIDEQLIHGNSATRLAQQMARLAEFTHLHFGCEESLLRRVGYPGLEKHRKAHQDLMNRLKLAVDRAENGDDVELARTIESVRDQYLKHVEQLDREYSEWLNARAIQ
jgi:hemerythrin